MEYLGDEDEDVSGLEKDNEEYLSSNRPGSNSSDDLDEDEEAEDANPEINEDNLNYDSEVSPHDDEITEVEYLDDEDEDVSGLEKDNEEYLSSNRPESNSSDELDDDTSHNNENIDDSREDSDGSQVSGTWISSPKRPCMNRERTKIMNICSNTGDSYDQCVLQSKCLAQVGESIKGRNLPATCLAQMAKAGKPSNGGRLSMNKGFKICGKKVWGAVEFELS